MFNEFVLEDKRLNISPMIMVSVEEDVAKSEQLKLTYNVHPPAQDSSIDI